MYGISSCVLQARVDIIESSTILVHRDEAPSIQKRPKTRDIIIHRDQSENCTGRRHSPQAEEEGERGGGGVEKRETENQCDHRDHQQHALGGRADPERHYNGMGDGRLNRVCYGVRSQKNEDPWDWRQDIDTNTTKME